MDSLNDPRSLAELLAEHERNSTFAARAAGIPRTTLQSRLERLGVSYERKSATVNVTDGADDLAVLQAENRDLKKRVAQAAQGDLADERVLRRIEAAIEKARPKYEAPPYERQPASKRSPQEMMLLYSDLHASEVVSREATNGLNEYDWTIMLERMGEVQRAAISHADHFGFNIEKFTVAMLGDMLSGDIHDELAITNDRPTADAIVDLAYDHLPWLLGFADHFGAVRVVAVPGNHPRRTKKPSFKQYHNNADWLFYEMLRALLQYDPRFEFEVHRSAMNIIQVADRWRMLLMHGDGIRTTMPGVPWGGISRRITTLEAQMQKAKQPLDYIALGHWHTRNVLDGVQALTFMNGSVKGLDEYSLQQFGSGRPAGQQLLTFQKERGWTGQYPIDLQGVEPASEGW